MSTLDEHEARLIEAGVIDADLAWLTDELALRFADAAGSQGVIGVTPPEDVKPRKAAAVTRPTSSSTATRSSSSSVTSTDCRSPSSWRRLARG